MKAVGIGRGNTLTIFVFIISFGNESGNGKARSEKRNRLCGISETVQFDRRHIGNGREPVLKSGNYESLIPSKVTSKLYHSAHRLRHKEYDTTIREENMICIRQGSNHCPADRHKWA
jgi:hypothetical protein